MNTKIFVMTHKAFSRPSDDLYVPLHVGSTLGKDLGYLRDDSGDNISDLNPYFGELTGFYWLWKNCHDVDIIGTCHYRRYFGIDGKLLNENDCEKLLSDCDVICSNIIDTEKESYKDEFSSAHNITDLELLGGAIDELYPEYKDAFDFYLTTNNHTYGNLCIMRKDLFDAYCDWMFNLFTWMMDKVEFTGYDAYHKRLFGFLSENLIRVFADANKLIVKPGHVYVTEEKAETIELKLALLQLIKVGQVSEAKKLFSTFLNYRPDVVLPLSDLSGELPRIAEIINKYLDADVGTVVSVFGDVTTVEEMIRIGI